MIDELKTVLLKATRWWLGELKACLPARMRNGGLLHPLIVVSAQEEDGYRLELFRWGARKLVSNWPAPDTDEDEEALSELLKAARGARSAAVLRLVVDDLLSKRIELPALADARLREAVGYQIAAHTPFAKDEVYFDCVSAGADGADGQLAVTVFLVPAAVVDGHLARLARSGIRVGRVTCAGHEGLRLRNDDLLPGTEQGTESLDRSLQRILWPTAAALLIALLMLYSRHLGLQRQMLTDANRAAIAQIKKGQSLKADIRSLAGRKGFLQRKKHDGVTPIGVLVGLGRILPRDARINMLSLRGAEVTINGVVADGAKVIQALEGSKRFNRARYTAPVVRERASGKEQFGVAVTALQEGATQ